jgi:hypothetical protein
MGELGLLLHVWTIDLVDALVRVVRDGCKGEGGRKSRMYRVKGLSIDRMIRPDAEGQEVHACFVAREVV